MADEPASKKRRVSIVAPSTSRSAAQQEPQSLVSDLSIVQFAESRALELVAMSRIARGVSGAKLPQQLVLRHMRRRAASHNIRRLPRRLRQAALRESARNPRAESKRPSRKHRRRPSNLLQEYARRQRQRRHAWLETHIWHAKRFHMTDRWRFKLPLRANDKGARAVYRASAKHCLLQDISFLTCIEITGCQNDTVDRLNRLTRKEVGLRFGAASYKKGQREGSIVVYEADTYPHRAIGPVQFMWKPQLSSEQDTTRSVLWIWVHPSVVNQLLRNLLLVLDISATALDVNGNKPEPHLQDPCTKTTDNAPDPKPNAAKEAVKVAGHSTKTNTTENSKRTAATETVKDQTAKTRDVRTALDAVVASLGIGDKQGNKKAKKKSGKRQNTSVVTAGHKRSVEGKSKTVDEQGSEEKSSESQDKISNSAESNEASDANSEVMGTVFKSSEFSLKLLNRELCRFHLTGPLSQAVLTRTLQVARVDSRQALGDGQALNDIHIHWNDDREKVRGEQVKTDEDQTKPQPDGRKWWEAHYARGEMLRIHGQQRAVWERLAGALSPAEAPPRCVLGLTVRDPRLQLPVKRGKTYPDLEDWNPEPQDEGTSFQCSPELSYSPLWEEEIRREVMDTKLPEQHINQLRSKLLVPGSRLDLGDEESRIPVLLVQFPGNQPAGGDSGGGRAGLGCGWDLILPARWAMAFWVPLIYRGARACGLQDSSILSASRGVLHFPSHYPDTEAGIRHQNDVTTEQRNKYSKKPASKRPNYLKNGVTAPFHAPWRELVANWRAASAQVSRPEKVEEGKSEEESQAEQCKFFVLRSVRLLRALNALCGAGLQNTISSGESEQAEKALKDEGFRKALVPVQVEMVSKGRPGTLSMICIPDKEDLKTAVEKKAWTGPEEAKHKVTTFPRKGKTKKGTKELKAKREEKLDELRTKAVKNVRWHCSREVAGFLSLGGFDLPSGQGAGVGFITLPALRALIGLRNETSAKGSRGKKGRVLVLVRNTTSRQYRFAHLSVFQSSIKLC